MDLPQTLRADQVKLPKDLNGVYSTSLQSVFNEYVNAISSFTLSSNPHHRQLELILKSHIPDIKDISRKLILAINNALTRSGLKSLNDVCI
jgi:hypothetical protein